MDAGSAGLFQSTPTRIPSRLLSSRLAPVLLHLPAVLTTILVWALTDDPTYPLRVGAVLCAPTYVGLTILEALRAPLFISPLSFYFAWYTVAAAPAAWNYADRIDLGESISFSVASVEPESIAAGYIIWLVGSVALHLGVQLQRPMAHGESLLMLSQRQEEQKPWRLPAAILFAAGLFVRLFYEQISFIGSVRGILSHASLAALSVLALSGARKESRASSFWVLLLLGTAVEGWMNIRSGSKAYIMFSFLPLIWLLISAPDLRKYLPGLGLGLTFFYLFIVAPVIGAARLEGLEPGERESVEHLVEVYQSDAREDDTEGPLNRFYERQFESIPIGFIHGEVERYGLRLGETMDYLAYAFIPRTFWPDKPSVTRGAWFTAYLGQSTSENTATTSTGQTAIGELYWNFGFFGVFAGMLLIGFMHGVIWRIAGAMPHQDGVRLLIYSSMSWTMADMPEAGTIIVADTVRIIVILALIGLFHWLDRLRSAREVRA